MKAKRKWSAKMTLVLINLSLYSNADASKKVRTFRGYVQKEHGETIYCIHVKLYKLLIFVWKGVQFSYYVFLLPG